MSFRVQTRLGVSAPAEIVWEVIADLPSWSEWNPYYTEAVGEIGFGKALGLTVALPGYPVESITTLVTSWTPEELLHLKMSLSGGLLRSTSYLEIDRLSDIASIFSSGEKFTGIGSYFVGRKMKRALRAGYEAMGEALKARAEALWQERGAVPTSPP